MSQQLRARAAALVAIGLIAGCTVHQTEAPSPTGPSEFGLSIQMTASPDSVTRDGFSQSAVTITALDETGQPKSGQALRVNIQSSPLGATLSASSLVTGSNGKATVIFTAPPPPALGTVTTANSATIGVTPIGSGASSAPTRTIDIRLMPVGFIIPSGSAPVSKFTFSPGSPTAGSAVAFDASTSCGGPVDASSACPTTSPTITSYSWTFGDGGSATGRVASHSFGSVGTFSVSLTVTNELGVQNVSTQAVATTTPPVPTGDFTVSPSAPSVGDSVNFNAFGVQAGAGHTIVQYSWDFGDGSVGGSGAQTQHIYSAAATYNVVLVVRDDTDQRKTFTKSVTIGTGNPVPVITFSPSSPKATFAVSFDSAGTTTSGGATIVTWAWTFGDPASGPANTSTLAAPTHTFATAGTYVVRLTVTDSSTPPRSGTATISVTVAP